MRHANYPDDAVQSYTLFFKAEILPLLGPSGKLRHPSWMTDDHTPLEFSLVLGRTGELSVRFAIETSALSVAGDCSIRSFRNTLLRLSFALTMKPDFDLDWFDVCAEELLLADSQQRPEYMGHPVSETFIGFDCTHYSAALKVYFMPRIRALVTKESPEEMMTRLTSRLGLDKPWAKITRFLSRFLPGDGPKIDIVAVDCVPGAQNRIKIYFRTDLLSFSHMEYLLTLGGSLASADVSTARLLWTALTDGTPTGSSRYFRSGLIYYELRPDRDDPTSKVYLPVRRYLENDLEISKSIERLGSRFSVPAAYSCFAQTIFSHRALSTRSGIHTYACCTVKPGGGDISLYYSPEAFAPERTVGLHGSFRRSFGPSSAADAQNIAALWVREWALLMNGYQDASSCLAPDCCLRDLLVFSSTFRMLEGKDKVVHHLHSAARRFYNFTILSHVTFKAVTDAMHLIQGRMHFEDDFATYNAVFTLSASTNGPWQCWALLTILDGLKHSSIPRSLRSRSAPFDTVIIGAGQAGLATAAQLQQLGMKVCVIERNSRVGGPWRDRYESLQFNTPKDFSHLPYFPFPEDWPMFPAARVVADHLERYPQILRLDVLTSTETVHADYNEGKKTWTIRLQHKDGSQFTLSASHLVVATGVDILGGQKPKMPQPPVLSNFRGQAMHSTAVRDVRQWIGKRVVVFGAGCSGHDLCMALSKQGAAEVTMIQRSPTAVISREVLLKLFPDMYTGENRPPIDVADELYLALPTPISKVLRGAMMERLVLLDADLHRKLREKGFQLPPGESDFIERLTVRRGGYYIDQGCSGLIVNGSINVRPYRSIQSFVSNGIAFADGDTLSADTIIFATGFEPDSKPAEFLDDSVLEKTGKIGGIDEEGEVIGLWRPSGHEHLWFAGGDLFNCRFYSRLLALQILCLQGKLDQV
ncbi:tryptophan dimethylallyltransferase-domain-containing protein [Mycena albidolilacea]|uniref:Tryptophan dimethylallyltransferase-domain-containing protein n=1 Tax=Mycena albidolilacea TaxID=1033008 RepID=A0AAD6Z7M7_9AGAR|nr:tryptophan dimethylallyltransferase-domain-containing protein [Mycena albidolilacea]